MLQSALFSCLFVFFVATSLRVYPEIRIYVNRDIGVSMDPNRYEVGEPELLRIRLVGTPG